MAADATIFFGLWLQKPLRIAAANPSGPRLADALARCADLERPGAVLELGAGTGSLTRGLMRAGCPPQRIVALEGEPRLVAVLRRDFPRMTVIEGLDLLGPGGRFLQITNAFSSPLPIDALGIAGREISRVWLNLLPAQIWSYSQRSETKGRGGPT